MAESFGWERGMDELRCWYGALLGGNGVGQVHDLAAASASRGSFPDRSRTKVYARWWRSSIASRCCRVRLAWPDRSCPSPLSSSRVGPPGPLSGVAAFSNRGPHHHRLRLQRHAPDRSAPGPPRLLALSPPAGQPIRSRRSPPERKPPRVAGVKRPRALALAGPQASQGLGGGAAGGLIGGRFWWSLGKRANASGLGHCPPDPPWKPANRDSRS
jgi:hypothetical protein